MAAHGAEYAKNSADIRAAADRLAAAMQEVGAYHWLKFIRDATEAADAPKTAAEINLERKKTDPRLDAASPTSAPDILVGGVGTLLRKGVVAAGGALAGAMVREFLPWEANARA